MQRKLLSGKRKFQREQSTSESSISSSEDVSIRGVVDEPKVAAAPGGGGGSGLWRKSMATWQEKALTMSSMALALGFMQNLG